LQARLALAGAIAQALPDAKPFLIAQGHKPAEVDALPTIQVVAIYMQRQYNETEDELLKWTYVPYWQGHAGIEAALKKVRSGPRNLQGILLGLRAPALAKVPMAMARLDRQIAGLRCIEAIRLHAATHDARLPTVLAEVKDVPLPVDPFTGKGF